MTRDIFQLSRLVTLHFPPVEKFQPSFCTLGGVLSLVFAPQFGKLLFWQRRKSLIRGDIAEKVMGNGKIWQISGLNSAIREIKHRVFFSRERQRGSRDLTFPAFAVCRPPFLLEEDIFPVWSERENVSICSPFLSTISTF